ncbi:MAG: hypothetical protein JWO94_470 [Verrucomicrobiaceae bacterium]|nr:hypothetical protein [Verrucomicrobiaceae bacterium]
MLDLQRQKYASKTNSGTLFARGLIFAHLACGPLAAIVMVFHERFMMAAVATLWFLGTVGLVAGMKNHLQWCRVGLALMWELAALESLGYLVWVVPGIMPEVPPALPLKVMPFWLSVWAMLYASGGFILLMSKRIERATMRGFELWPLPTR